MGLNSKQRKTKAAIFETPVRSNILWTDIVSLLKAMGADITQGKGSRVRIYLNGQRAVFHEPHPEKETDKGALTSVREFLENAGFGETEEEEDADAQGLQRTF